MKDAVQGKGRVHDCQWPISNRISSSSGILFRCHQSEYRHWRGADQVALCKKKKNEHNPVILLLAGSTSGGGPSVRQLETRPWTLCKCGGKRGSPQCSSGDRRSGSVPPLVFFFILRSAAAAAAAAAVVADLAFLSVPVSTPKKKRTGLSQGLNPG